MNSRPSPARTRLLDAAADLFYARGVSATGIDAIVAEAGVAKMSLYNNFSSKEDLVEAYLQERHEEWLDLHAARLRAASTPVQRVLSVFDAYLDHAEKAYDHGFRGCGLLNAAAELPTGSPGRDAVRRHKEQVEAILADLLADTGHETAVAEHLAFLLEGAVSRAGLEGHAGRLRAARSIAASLLESS